MKKLLASSMTLALIASLAFAGEARAYFPTGEDPEGNGAGCGQGKMVCEVRQTQICTEWFANGGNLSIGPQSIGVGITWTCKRWETTTKTTYYP